ncbi:hypothetical protein ACFSQE_09785 [Vogesella fluminis]|uniref:hypothetical protein n=1 Tax=Vogesella fluminis TaxID=1069161 RepID=UPI00363E61BE
MVDVKVAAQTRRGLQRGGGLRRQHLAGLQFESAGGKQRFPVHYMISHGGMVLEVGRHGNRVVTMP